MTYLDCWISSAAALFPQALAGAPQLVESSPRPVATPLAFMAVIAGDQEGRFSVILDREILDFPLFGEGVEQHILWGELLREVADAAAGELLAKTGQKCRVAGFETSEGEDEITRAFQLQSGDRGWTILICNDVHAAEAASPVAATPNLSHLGVLGLQDGTAPSTSGTELLYDVELEATLRFGCRELPLGEILELGAGDVVQLDRHISDPADLIVGDKIVARGEVVLVNGNFGLRVTQVATPRKRLESIRCLF